MKSFKDQIQPKVTDGEQKVILDERITGETDQLDPAFAHPAKQPEEDSKTTEPGNDPRSKLI